MLFCIPPCKRNGLGVAAFAARRGYVCRRRGWRAEILKGSNFFDCRSDFQKCQDHSASHVEVSLDRACFHKQEAGAHFDGKVE